MDTWIHSQKINQLEVWDSDIYDLALALRAYILIDWGITTLVATGLLNDRPPVLVRNIITLFNS